jgi:hypothetical protein
MAVPYICKAGKWPGLPVCCFGQQPTSTLEELLAWHQGIKKEIEGVAYKSVNRDPNRFSNYLSPNPCLTENMTNSHKNY